MCVVITIAMVMLFRDFGLYEIIFMNVCVVITIAMVMLLRDFGPYGIIFMTMCVNYFRLVAIKTLTLHRMPLMLFLCHGRHGGINDDMKLKSFQ
jgi:hypothetical protein